jgi:hypothetical protein
MEINAGITIDKHEMEDRFNTPVLDVNYGIGKHIHFNYKETMNEQNNYSF